MNAVQALVLHAAAGIVVVRGNRHGQANGQTTSRFCLCMGENKKKVVDKVRTGDTFM